ncbi:MAG TPA: EAL domain-containing protein [Rhodocyclaceae bacterium]
MTTAAPPKYLRLMCYTLGLYALAALALSEAGEEVFIHLHLALDTSNAVLSLLLAIFLLSERNTIQKNLRNYVVIGFAFAAATESIHALIGIEWNGALAWIEDYSSTLRPATWPPSTYVLPIAMGLALLQSRRRTLLSTGAFIAVMMAVSATLFALSFKLPRYLDTGILGIQRPTQAPLLLLWAVVIVGYWRQRHNNRLFEGLALMGGLLFLSDLFMLYSTAPHEKFAMIAHTGKLLAYALLHVIQMRASGEDADARNQAEERIRNLLTEQSLIFDNAHVGIVMVRNRLIVKCNQRLAEMFGYASPKEIEGHSTEILFCSPEQFLGVGADIYTTMAEHGFVQYETKMQRKDGEQLWIMLRGRPINPAAVQDGSIWVYTDITERMQSEADLRIAAAAFDSQEGMVITDANSVILRVNRAFTEITGYSAEEVVGQRPNMLKSSRHSEDFYRQMWQAIERTGSWQGEIWDRRKNGEEYPKWLTISAVKDDQGKVTHYIGSQYDITERKRSEEKIRGLAYFDQLTGLHNRFSLHQRLNQAVGLAQRHELRLGLMLIDLDNFKTINDTQGHHTGDQLLVQVAERLGKSVRQSDLVARLGGDEFVILLPDIDSPTDVAHVADKILASISAPYVIDGQEFRTSPSIGICLYPDDAAESQELIKKADVAMYHAKANGRGNYQFFTEEMQQAALHRLSIEADLRTALKEQQFVLHYQPQLDLRNGQLVGVEALIRWQHPERGLVPPMDFIPIAEETGQIAEIGDWVLQEACRQLANWRDGGIDGISVSVNLSPGQFLDPALADRIHALLRQYGLGTDKLDIEITESMSMESPNESVALMNELRARGLSLSIDDFGTGYSSLAYLKLFPISTLKIDRSFVKDIETDPNDADICDVTVLLAHKLGLTVTAEGVETAAQLKYLLSIGCEKIQGYLISKPLPAAEVEAFLRSSHDFPTLGTVDLWAAP